MSDKSSFKMKLQSRAVPSATNNSDKQLVRTLNFVSLFYLSISLLSSREID